MNNYFYEMLFPDVSFRDKICVVFSNGSSKIYKHLYLNRFILKEIEWENVVDCYEVQLIYIAYYEVVGSIKLTPRRKGTDMYRVLFDDNIVICEDLDIATEVAMGLREADYENISIVPAQATDLDSFIEVEI